jgi:hypothetical protein
MRAEGVYGTSYLKKKTILHESNVKTIILGTTAECMHYKREQI